MIVMKTSEGIWLFEQHHHALASGVMARNWREEDFSDTSIRKEVEYAIAHHDRGWISLDARPKWNEEKDQPYSFIDYSMFEKMKQYHAGVDQVERKTKYGALLCSMHYRSFFPDHSEDSEIQQFIHKEEKRQRRLYEELDKPLNQEQITFHFRLLQFCDDLSLYCCMNFPGSTKEEELDWFRDGFRQRFAAAPKGLQAWWKNEQEIELDPFPFADSFQLDIPYKYISFDQMKGYSLKDMWNSIPLRNRPITIVQA